MLDDDDSRDFADVVSESGGWVLLVGVALLLVILLIVHGNRVDCVAQKCASGEGARLIDHQCMCIEPVE